jgi:hypothetical protein
MSATLARPFALTPDQVRDLHTDQAGRYHLAAEINSFRRLNGMRSGLNLTTAELLQEGLHWATHASAEGA